MDVYEDRKGYNSESIGDYALKLYNFIKSKGFIIAISDLLISELEVNYSLEKINGMMKPFEHLIQRIIVNKEERNEAADISRERRLPCGDVLHAIIARNYNAVLITRDKHFRKLKDISISYKPEDII
ncbi:PIN domain-containing protein [Nanoarchaeota archaeon]